MRLSPRAAALVFALALALCFASTLGLMHRVLHGTAQDAPGASAQALHPHHAGPSDGLAGSGLMALFGDHENGECRLYDQLAGGAAALGVPWVVLPLVLPTARFDYFQGEAIARWVALLRARGPPVTR